MPKHIDLIGEQFGRLKVISENSRNQRGVVWNCKCDCGNDKIVSGVDLRKGKTKSCGCLFDEVSKVNLKIAHTTNKLEYGMASFNQVWYRYNSHARHRNLTFELTKDEFKNFTKQNCYYCGVEPKQIQTSLGMNGEYIYNGVDRIDSNLGYNMGNCVACCGRCNEAKMSENQTDFINWIEKVYKNLLLNNIIKRRTMHKKLLLSILLLVFLGFTISMSLYYSVPDFQMFINQLFIGK